MLDLDIMRSSQGQARRAPTQLERLLNNHGGSYKSSGRESVFFHMYTGVEFRQAKAERRTFTIGLKMYTPPGTPRSDEQRKRVEYWKHSRRLSNGNLVALMLVTGGDSRVFLGTVASAADDIAESSKANKEYIMSKVSFFDPEVELYALQGKKMSMNRTTFAILIDNSVMYDALRPFLETLQTVEPTSIPFHQYIASEDSLASVHLPPPQYTLAHGFEFDLRCLVGRNAPIQTLNTRNPDSVAHVRAQLAEHSSLDESQAQSIVDALTRQIALIQG
jgi:hypothetical protein